MRDDDCGPEIKDLHNTEILRTMAHREALRRPDFDEFTTRVIALIQLVEAQKRTAETLAAVDRNDREHWARDQKRIERLTAERDAAFALVEHVNQQLADRETQRQHAVRLFDEAMTERDAAIAELRAVTK